VRGGLSHDTRSQLTTYKGKKHKEKQLGEKKKKHRITDNREKNKQGVSGLKKVPHLQDSIENHFTDSDF
jgi:hypothetical protein